MDGSNVFSSVLETQHTQAACSCGQQGGFGFNLKLRWDSTSIRSWTEQKPLATPALNDFILRTCAHCVRWIRANTSRTSQFLAVGCETHVWMFSSCGQDPKPTQRERLLLSSFTCDSFWMQAHRWRQRISTASTEAGLADVDWKVWLSKLVGLHIPSSYLWFMDRALAEDEWLFKFELFRGLAQTLHKRNQCNPSNHCPTCTGALTTEWLCVSQYFGNTNCLKRAFFLVLLSEALTIQYTVYMALVMGTVEVLNRMNAVWSVPTLWTFFLNAADLGEFSSSRSAFDRYWCLGGFIICCALAR